MLVLACESTYLLNLGRSNVEGIDAAEALAFVMNLEHDSRRLLSTQSKKLLQYHHDEIHRRVVVIQQQHPVESWRLGLAVLRFEYATASIILLSRCHEVILMRIVESATLKKGGE